MTIYEKMLAQYGEKHEAATPNAAHEVMQQIALAGLHRGGFFDHAAFYGGTCLRIFHDLPRFSEDMDFSLIEKRDDIHLENYFQAIEREFQMAGLSVTIAKKDKKIFGRVESAFLKENTETYEIKFQTKKTVKIKIELDTDPPLQFETEQKMLLQPYSFMVRCFTLPDLYAGKMHALVYRAWQRRIKGRDWYDFEWYVRNGIPLDFNHLQARIKSLAAMKSTGKLLWNNCVKDWRQAISKWSRRMCWALLTIPTNSTSGATTISSSWPIGLSLYDYERQ